MSDLVNATNFTPLPSQEKPKSKKNLVLFLISFLFIFIAGISLFSYLTLSKRPQVTKPRAAFNATKVCGGSSGQTVGTINVSHKFNSLEECQSCQQGNCDAAQLVGQPTDCGRGQTCVPGSPISCIIPAEGGSCTFTVPVPDCSVYQIDCGNGAWPSLGSISGGIAFNCQNCGGTSPTPTPFHPTNTPTPTPTRSPSPSPTPTQGPSVTPTPGPSATPTPGPSATPTPGPSATPTTGPSATPTTGPSATPTPAKPTILQTGGSSQHWYLIPLGIILTGLLL